MEAKVVELKAEVEANLKSVAEQMKAMQAQFSELEATKLRLEGALIALKKLLESEAEIAA